MLPVDFLLMVNSIRHRILLIVCDIFVRKIAISGGRLSVQDHSRLLILVPIESACCTCVACSYWWSI